MANQSNPGDGNAPDTFEALKEATQESGGLFGRMNKRLQEAINSGRGDNRQYNARAEAGDNPRVTSDDLALRRARNTKPRKMVIPDGVIIQGSLTSGSESEVAGRIEGDLFVDGDLMIAPSALVSGNVRTVRCRVEGLVDGRLECSDALDLGQSGRLNNDVVVGNQFVVAGQVFGNILCGGLLRLTPSAKVTGNVHCKRILIEEGAVLNGQFSMRTPAQKPRIEQAAAPSAEAATVRQAELLDDEDGKPGKESKGNAAPKKPAKS